MKYLLRIMRYEGFYFTVNLYDSDLICTDPDNFWFANCAIPNFKIIKYSHSEFLNFSNFRGVISKTFYIPLLGIFLKMFNKIDNILSRYFPNIFSLQRQIV